MTTTADHDPGVRTGRRIGEVDALRGFALFGILIPNVVAAVTRILGVQGGEFSFIPRQPGRPGGVHGRGRQLPGQVLRAVLVPVRLLLTRIGFLPL
jgi:hypothetical protein